MYTHIYFLDQDIFNAECLKRDLKPTSVSYEYGETQGVIDFKTSEKLILCDVAYNSYILERGH